MQMTEKGMDEDVHGALRRLIRCRYLVVALMILMLATAITTGHWCVIGGVVALAAFDFVTLAILRVNGLIER
jgi:hypothetical protein